MKQKHTLTFEEFLNEKLDEMARIATSNIKTKEDVYNAISPYKNFTFSVNTGITSHTYKRRFTVTLISNNGIDKFKVRVTARDYTPSGWADGDKYFEYKPIYMDFFDTVEETLADIVMEMEKELSKEAQWLQPLQRTLDGKEGRPKLKDVKKLIDHPFLD